MAQDVQTKILEIEVRYEAAIEQIAKYRREIEETRKAQGDLKQAHKNGIISTTEFQKSMAAADQQVKFSQSAISTLTQQIQLQTRAEKEKTGSLNQLRSQLSAATKQYDSMSRAERESAKGIELKEKINRITAELKSAEEETSRFYRNVGNYNEAEEGLGKVENKAKDLGKAMLALAGISGMKALSDRIREVGVAYADQMGKVQAVTNANTVEFAQMSKEVERLGATTRYTAQEAGEAMEFLTRNGLNAVAATGTLSGVLELAQANAIELAEAADIVTGQMNAFHLSVGDVTRINDVLSYTCANSATNILQLNEALRNSAPIAYTAGVSIEETCAALATLADNNIKGADSGTILRQAFNGMLTATAKTKKAYKELGIEMNIATVQQDGFVKSLKRIMDAAPSVQQLSDIFGRRAVPGVLALTNSMEMLEKKFGMITANAENTTARMFEQSYSSYTIASKSLESAWEGFLIQIWQGTNQSLRDRFVAEANEIDKQYAPIIDGLTIKRRELEETINAGGGDDATLAELQVTVAQLTNATREYGQSKQNLANQMQVENYGSGMLSDMWEEGAKAIDDAYAPTLDALSEKQGKLMKELSDDPTNGNLSSQLKTVGDDLSRAATEYAIARQTLAGQMAVENTGDDALIAKWKEGAAAVGNEYIPKIDALKERLSGLRAEQSANPADAEINGQIAETAAQLNAAISAYASARQEFQVSMQGEISAATENAGLSGMLEGPLNALAEMIRYVKANIEELGTMLAAIIGGISLTALVRHVKASAATMKTDLIANAESATAKVNSLQKQRGVQTQQVCRLEVQYEQAAASERQLIANKLTIQKQQLAETEKALTKAKTAEIKAMETAAASATATGWKGAMLSAQLAVKGFVTASKAVLKSFALTAILSLAIELIMKLWSSLNSGEGTIGRIGSAITAFVKDAMQKLMQTVEDVCNYFIELYNDSALVRAGIAYLGGVFNAVWTVVKAGVESVINLFKLLGDIIAADAKVLKGMLTLDWDAVKEGLSQGVTAFKDFFNAQVANAKEAGADIIDGFADSFANMDRKIEPVKLNAVVTEEKTVAENATIGGGSSGMGGDADGEDGNAGGGNGGGNGNDKKDKERQRRQKLEMEALSNLENELYKIEEEGAEKRRKAVEASYDKRIARLRTQLATEKGLTETARKAICDLIIVLEQEKDDELYKLSLEEHKRVLEEEISNSERKLALVREGTAEELNIRLDALQKKHEIEVQEMENAIDVERRKIDKLNEIDAERYAAMTDDERAAYDRQKEEATAALGRKQEALLLSEEQYNRDVDATVEENEAAKMDRQKLALQNELAEMELANTERQNMTVNYLQMNEEEYAQWRQRGLDAMDPYQAELLAKQEENAQAEYDALVERGQLSTQTEEEFRQEQIDAKQRLADAGAKINAAIVQDEQAKAQAMKSVTNGLCSLLDALGESNEAFAKMSKIITLAQIAIDTGRALSAGIASASAVPFPANLAAIATTVATVLANIATAISTVKSAKFAEGGKVVGAGTGTSDSIPAMLSNGEYVMTARATRLFEPLLAAMNGIGGGVPMQASRSYESVSDAEMMTDSFAAAAREIRPRVSVVEISEAQERVGVIENLDTF